ncbi:uncharacterized protein LOC111037336 [Myzus persicae]|uniref:uncharacterized protein LOC111037336 n=1 Tax=Myzus persicae TaxID=13164 RepID=UPI000B9367A3|nr:uncharacterized protein LOC111037336 [Myzus persicae]
MNGNEFRSDCSENQLTPTTSMVSSRPSTRATNRSKRCAPRIRWLDEDECKSLRYDDGAITKQTSARPTIHRSVASTDLTRAACRGVGGPYDTDQSSEPDTGSAVASCSEIQQCSERYGLVATPGCAGTFKMSIVSDAFFGPEVECLIEFKVWKTMASPELKRLWFTVRHAMSPAAATAIQTLEVWTDRKDGCPAKVVFLQK